ncbi:MAG: glycine zipper 2TM domain-containing protein [Gallionella sp.]|nr:glycine zipper 2TM domain-containing protein [Gallionella sp.]
MKTAKTVIATFLAVAVLMSGCANTDSRSASSSPSYSGAAYGVIDAIETARGSSDIGAGAVIGGIVGGVLGHQVGGGTGQDVATVAGVVGGAVAGHQIEKSSKQQDAYHIRVRLDNGRFQTVTQQSIIELRVGDRVRIENDRVSRY